MHIKKDFDYYYCLKNTVTNALLYLLMTVAANPRHVPIAKRNELLIRYLKPKLNDKSLKSVKKDIKLMISTARAKSGNLERKLYELNERANQTLATDSGTEKLYHLLNYLHEHHGIDSQLFQPGQAPQTNTLYMLEEHIEHGFSDTEQQIAPLSMLIESERAPQLIDIINQQGAFSAEMKEWNPHNQQAHILVHPS